MFAETPPEGFFDRFSIIHVHVSAFNVNSLFVDSHQIVERSNEPMKNHVISKKECQELYPHHDGVDGESFYDLIAKFRSRHFAEKLICLCDFDFSLATRLGTLCHGNIFLLKRLCFLFSNDLSSALRFLDCFSSSSSSSSSSFLLCSQFLSFFNNDVSSASSFLSLFNNKVSSASSFLSLFHNDGSSASSFLSLFHNAGSSADSFLTRFNDGYSASSFLSRFDNNVSAAEQALKQIPSKFSDESSFKLALRGCNGGISAVEAFSRLSGIKHLELLYDSELLPRNPSEFHFRCDSRGPTVSFICSSGKCVCGVVQSSWTNTEDEDDDVVAVSDTSAYLLRLSPNPLKFPINSNKAHRALFCGTKNGPSFGKYDLITGFTKYVKYPNGMYCNVDSGSAYNLPKNDFLLPTTDRFEAYPIDRIVVCKFTK